MSDTYLPFALPDVNNSELAQIKEALDSGWITTGPKARRFEGEFAAFVGATHAVAVNSCTAAMHLALEATGLQAGDLVITTPYTFAATVEVIRYFDAVPVFVDVEADTLNMDPNLFYETVTDLCHGGAAARRRLPRAATRPHSAIRSPHAIIPVHIAGLPVDLDAIQAFAIRHGLAVIEDAAHALGSAYKGRPIGTGLHAAIGNSPQIMTPETGCMHLACFSFYATKALTTGEGGMICTDDAELAERCRIMSLHGISKDAWKRYTAEGSWYYEIIAPGYKYNMTDIAAAMGLAQLAKVERMAERRREIAERYHAAFSAMPELQIPEDRPDCRHAWHLYMLRLHLDRLALSRAAFIEALKARGIGSSVHFIPLHIHPYYRETYGYSPEHFPVAFREYLREISLPIYSRMSDADIQRVIEAVGEIVLANRA